MDMQDYNFCQLALVYCELLKTSLLQLNQQADLKKFYS